VFKFRFLRSFVYVSVTFSSHSTYAPIFISIMNYTDICILKYIYIYLYIFIGIEFDYIPETNGIPLVADMSSNILTKSFDISKVNISYNKNILKAEI